MTNADTLELVSPDNDLIKPTPVEETLKKIAKMSSENIKVSNNNAASRKISKITNNALVYTVKYLRDRHWLSDNQIRKLSYEDMQHVIEMIFANRGREVLLFGWIPVFGWIFAGKYLLFKNRVKFLRLLDKNLFDFDGSDIEKAIQDSRSRPYLHGC